VILILILSPVTSNNLELEFFLLGPGNSTRTRATQRVARALVSGTWAEAATAAPRLWGTTRRKRPSRSSTYLQ